MQARSTAWPTNGIREPGGAHTVAMTRVPGDRLLTNCSALASSRLIHPVSRYRNAKNTTAPTANPARCHFLGLSNPSTPNPKIADIVVSREPSSPIHPPSGDGRKFSGSSAVAQNATTYNSNGSSNLLHLEPSRLSAYTSTATQKSPNKKAAPAR